MTSHNLHLSTLPTRTRWLAAWLAGVVLALSVLAVAPHAHEALHADAHDEDHACVITWFHQGVDFPLASPEAPTPVVGRWGSVSVAQVEPDVTAPRYLHLPGRAPPAWVG